VVITEVEKSILTALTELDAGARGIRQGRPGPQLGVLLARVDSLTEQLPKEASSELTHFLRRKSYDKALQLLRGCVVKDARSSGHSCV
jgi:hypothetical protein